MEKLHKFDRLSKVIGDDNVLLLSEKTVLVLGVGGVGGHCVLSLARAGVGNIDLIDNDTVSVTNINRQLIALNSTVGLYKVDVARDRLLDINPDLSVKTLKIFYTPENTGDINFKDYDYVVDAVDTVTAKIELILRANSLNIPIISCMGTGNKLDPTRFEITDIYKTSVCPLAKVMRKELKQRKRIKYLLKGILL